MQSLTSDGHRTSLEHVLVHRHHSSSRPQLTKTARGKLFCLFCVQIQVLRTLIVCLIGEQSDWWLHLIRSAWEHP